MLTRCETTFSLVFRIHIRHGNVDNVSNDRTFDLVNTCLPLTICGTAVRNHAFLQKCWQGVKRQSLWYWEYMSFTYHVWDGRQKPCLIQKCWQGVKRPSLGSWEYMSSTYHVWDGRKKPCLLQICWQGVKRPSLWSWEYMSSTYMYHVWEGLHKPCLTRWEKAAFMVFISSTEMQLM